MSAHLSFPFSTDDLKRLAITDDLTGLYNRRYFQFRLNEELERARRSDRELSVLLLDLDGFKSINDMYGHLRGDRLLADFADIIVSVVRPFDLVARYAGDEFVILLPESKTEEAFGIAERLRQKVAQTSFPGNPALKITISMGVATFPNDADTVEALIEYADKGLYAAKRKGRNRFSTADQKDQDQKSSEINFQSRRLVGRDEELFLLTKALQSLLKNESNCVLLTGEPGVGRSCVLSEFQERAVQTGVEILSEPCVEGGRFIPFYPFRECLRRFFSENSNVAMQSLLALTEFQRAEFMRLLPDLEPSKLRLSEDVFREVAHEEIRLFDAISNLFFQITKVSKLVILIDDVQWLDEASMKLLIYLMRNAEKHNILYAFSYLEGDEGTTIRGKLAFSNWMASIKPLIKTTLIQLYRFNQDQTREYIQSLLGQNMPSKFSDLIHKESEGIPFFIEEILKSLVDQKKLTKNSEGWHFREVNHLAAPESIRDFVAKRLNALDTKEKEILTLAAVIGRTFTFDTLLSISGRNEGHLLDLLEKLEKAQLIFQRPSREGERYQFKHNKVREVMYDRMDSTRRRLVHRNIASAMERMYSGKTELIAGELAHHYVQARQIENALNLYRSAGDKAVNLYSDSLALRYYVRAIKLARQNPKNFAEELSVFHQKSARILENQGRREMAIREYKRALKQGKSSLTYLKQAQICRQIAEIYIDFGQFEKAGRTLFHAEKLLDPERDFIEVLRVGICKCTTLLRHGEYEACLEQTSQWIDKLEQSGNLIELSDLYDLRAAAENSLGNRDQAVRLYSRSLELRRQGKDLARITTSYKHLAGIFMDASRWNDAIFWYNKCIKIESSRGRLAVMAEPHVKLGKIFLSKGEMSKAAHHVEKAKEIYEISNDQPGLAECLILQMHISLEKEDHANADKYLSLAEEIYKKTEVKMAGKSIMFARARLEFDKKNIDTASKLSEEILQTNELFGDPASNAHALLLSGQIQNALKKHSQALENITRAQKLFHDLGCRYEEALCIKEMGKTKIDKGEIAEGLKDLRHSKRMFVTIGSGLESKKTSALIETIKTN